MAENEAIACIFAVSNFYRELMFDTYPKLHYPEYVHACLCYLVAIVSLRTALGSLKEEERKKEDEEDEQFAWATISVYHFRNVC